MFRAAYNMDVFRAKAGVVGRITVPRAAPLSPEEGASPLLPYKVYEEDGSQGSATPPPGVRQGRRVPHPWLSPGTFREVRGLLTTPSWKDVCNAVVPRTPWTVWMSTRPKMEWVPE
ncbi:uncharacterized protein LOC144141437 [Haemaphysalis longicornis]